MSDHRFQLVTIVLDKGFLAFLALFAGFWLKKWQEDHTLLLKKHEDERVSTLQRDFVPRCEFELHCDFFGPEGDDYLVYISLRITNRGKTRRTFKSIAFRLRGIEEGAPLEYFNPELPGRLRFQKPLLRANFVDRPENEYHFYIEPQVSQVFTYVSKIPANIRYVLAYASMVPVTDEHEEEGVFAEERLFQVRPVNGNA